MIHRFIASSLIEQLWGISVCHKKDQGQRKVCGCAISKDIGVNDSCLHGCRYCYATNSEDVALKHYRSHNPESPTM